MTTALLAISIAATTLLLVVATECFLALAPLRRNRLSVGDRRPSIAIVMPAHNEAGVVGPSVRSLVKQLQPGDRLVVIADNCDDDTAMEAAEAGATVWPRRSETERGKGYAVQYAIDKLKESPPEVLVSIDADCQLGDGCLDQIARLAHSRQRPVQSSYVMSAGDAGGAKSAVSALAVLLKNSIRPRGLQRIGMPCLLTGSGMAFPWSAIENTTQRLSHIVEDMAYTTDLALAGYVPMPCMEAETVSSLPSGEAAFQTQRTRWEHGHLMTIASEAPRLLKGFLRTGRVTLLALLLELLVPPLLLLFAGAGAAILLMAAASLAGAGWGPTLLLAAASATTVLALLMVWGRFGRKILPPAQLAAVPSYLVAKAPIYSQFMSKRQSSWVRTARETTAPAPHLPAEQMAGHVPAATAGASPGGEGAASPTADR